jgi:hypothetical protein
MVKNDSNVTNNNSVIFDNEIESRLQAQRKRVAPTKEKTKSDKVQMVASLILFAVLIFGSIFGVLSAFNLIG